MKSTIYKTDGTKEYRALTAQEVQDLLGANFSEKKLIRGKLCYREVDEDTDNPHFAIPSTLEDGTPTFIYPYKGVVICFIEQ